MGNTCDIGPVIPTDVTCSGWCWFDTRGNALTSVAEKSTVILWLLGTVLFSMKEINSLGGVSTCCVVGVDLAAKEVTPQHRQ